MTVQRLAAGTDPASVDDATAADPARRPREALAPLDGEVADTSGTRLDEVLDPGSDREA